jgi:hypothetical protein
MQVRVFLPDVDNGEPVHTVHVKVYKVSLVRMTKLRTCVRQIDLPTNDIQKLIVVDAVEDNGRTPAPKPNTKPKFVLAEVDALQAGTWYDFTSASSNIIGQSEFSEFSIPYQTKDTSLPDRMAPPEVRDVTSRSVTVVWAPPTRHGGAVIRSYILEKYR